MESYKQLAKDARKAFDTADHLTYVTYPLVKESRLIITIIEHVNQALQNAMQALLVYERMYKRISYIPNEFMSRMYMLRQSILPRYKMEEFASLILELREIMENRKKSNMEFIRKEKYFIYANSYSRISSVGIDSIKDYLVKTRRFLDNIDRVLGETNISSPKGRGI